VIDPQTLTLIDAFEPVPFAGEAFRHLARDVHPLSGVGARIHGGRWNPPGSFSTLYLGLERETPVLEFYRLAKRNGRAPEDFLPRQMYRYRIALTAVLDLRAPSARADFRLGDHSLGSDDTGRCQQIGETAHYLGLEGLLAPSAAGKGTVLAVFFDCLHANSQIQPLSHELWTVPPQEP
jgi:RES domain-containing protein